MGHRAGRPALRRAPAGLAMGPMAGLSRAAAPTPPEAGRPAIPLAVVGGFLGAGKTSLINHLLATPDAPPATILVNDFGSLEIDAALIRARNGDTLSLANGCVCCSLGGDLIQALLALERRPELPRRLLIEASGVADPGKVAQLGLLAAGYRLEAVVVVVDAGAFPSLLADPRLGDTLARQVRCADLLVVNKSDTVGPAERQALDRLLDGLAPGTPRLPTREGRIAPALLFPAWAEPPGAGTGQSAPPVRATDAPHTAHDVYAAAGGPSGPGDAMPAYYTCVRRYGRPLPEAAARQVFDRELPGGLLRGKALLRLDGGERVWLWQRAGGRSRWEALAVPPPGLAAGESRVVLIGLAGLADAGEERLARAALASLGD